MTIKRVFAVLLFVELFNMGVRSTLDPDMWWHLQTGHYIWSHGIPRQDPFSFTVPGSPWTTHEWFSEVVMWAVYWIGGLPGLSIVFALFSALAFWLIYRCCPGQPYLAGAVTALGGFAASSSFGVRCQVLNMLFMASFVHVIERVRSGDLSRRALYVLPLLTIAWANFHSGVLLGVVVLVTYAAGEWLGAQVLRKAPAGVPSTAASSAIAKGGASLAHQLAFAALACLATAAINPAGYHLWTYPFDTLGSDLMQKNIAEWQSPDFHLKMYWPFAGLLLFGALLWGVSPRRPTWTELLLFLGTAAAGLMSSRHIALFAVVAVPIVSRALVPLAQPTFLYRAAHERDDEPVSGTKAVINWVVLVVGAMSLLSMDISKLAGNHEDIAKVFPVAAVDYLQREGLAADRGWNSYTWGGYLIWRGLPVFIDGRADVYGEFLGYYLKTVNVASDWKEPLTKYKVGYVLTEPKSQIATLLAATGEWREQYADEVAKIFVRGRGSDLNGAR